MKEKATLVRENPGTICVSGGREEKKKFPQLEKGSPGNKKSQLDKKKII